MKNLIKTILELRLAYFLEIKKAVYFLNESSMGTITQDKSALDAWCSFVNEIKKSTHAGGHSKCRVNGAIVNAPRAHRYSDKAKDAYLRGVRIESFGNLGAAEYLLE